MIVVKDLYKSFGEPSVDVLKGLNFTIPSKTFVSITGRSGSGKSTLLYSMSTLDNPTKGQVFLNDVNTTDMTEAQVHQFRNEKMGFVFQFHYLLPELTAIENVLMPARKTNQHELRRERAKMLLDQFDLQGKYDRLPKHLSGGEQQRVAIARSLILEPEFIFADEPTGNLDSVNAEVVMKILKQVTRDHNTTVIFVTHDPDFAELADHKIRLVDGKIAEEV